MVIFHSYVSLPEGIWDETADFWMETAGQFDVF